MDLNVEKIQKKVEAQRVEIAQMEKKLSEFNAAADEKLLELIDLCEAKRKARMGLVSTQTKNLESWQVAQLGYLVANGVSQRSTQLHTNHVLTGDALGECDCQLEQQINDAIEFAKLFDEEELEVQNTELKTEIYELTRSIDEVDVDILDLRNSNASLRNETTEKRKVLNLLTNHLSKQNTEIDAKIATVKGQIEESAAEVEDYRSKFNRYEQEVIEISEKLARLNETEQ